MTHLYPTPTRGWHRRHVEDVRARPLTQDPIGTRTSALRARGKRLSALFDRQTPVDRARAVTRMRPRQ